MVSVAPELMVMLLALASAVLIFGLLVVPEGMVTLVTEVGTTPQLQLDAVFQSLLVEPTQLCPTLLTTKAADTLLVTDVQVPVAI